MIKKIKIRGLSISIENIFIALVSSIVGGLIASVVSGFVLVHYQRLLERQDKIYEQNISLNRYYSNADKFCKNWRIENKQAFDDKNSSKIIDLLSAPILENIDLVIDKEKYNTLSYYSDNISDLLNEFLSNWGDFSRLKDASSSRMTIDKLYGLRDKYDYIHLKISKEIESYCSSVH